MTTQTVVELQALKHDGTLLTTDTRLDAAQGRVLGTTSDQETPTAQVSKKRSYIIILQLAGIQFLSSFANGTLTVGLPTIAESLGLHDDLLIWPNSVFYLTCGTLLLVAGAVADVVGPRKVALTGCLLLTTFILACGFARTAIDLIMFRAMAGIAVAMISPSSVSLISASTEAGSARNVGFACIGLSMPLGFSSGLVLGGIFADTIGWRTGYYICGSLGYLFFAIGLWALPKDRQESGLMNRLKTEIDWIGAIFASSALATLSYVLATLSVSVTDIKKASNIAILTISICLFVAFFTWVQWQEKRGKPALIPNSLWKKASFTAMCLMVMLCTAICDAMELFCSLYFQNVQDVSALGASLRILPSAIIGAMLNFATGVFVDRVPAMYAVLISSGLCAVGPILMAINNPSWPYWYDAFFAQLLLPLSADVLFTVGLLVVSDNFPAKTQALAGAVFNTCSQLGISIGLTTMSIISTSVTNNSAYQDKNSSDALILGYRASFWAMFSWMATACVIGIVGLRGVGKVGLKRE